MVINEWKLIGQLCTEKGYKNQICIEENANDGNGNFDAKQGNQPTRRSGTVEHSKKFSLIEDEEKVNFG